MKMEVTTKKGSVISEHVLFANQEELDASTEFQYHRIVDFPRAVSWGNSPMAKSCTPHSQ
jgi:hypothetical protein